jgi:hypothetical protein
MTKKIVLLALVSMLLSSCVVLHDRNHCPPGQAKKGNC